MSGEIHILPGEHMLLWHDSNMWHVTCDMSRVKCVFPTWKHISLVIFLYSPSDISTPLHLLREHISLVICVLLVIRVSQKRTMQGMIKTISFLHLLVHFFAFLQQFTGGKNLKVASNSAGCCSILTIVNVSIITFVPDCRCNQCYIRPLKITLT